MNQRDPASSTPAARLGAELPGDTILGDVPCPVCRAPHAWRLRHIGVGLNCERCGEWIPIGETLCTPRPKGVPGPERQAIPERTRTPAPGVTFGVLILVGVILIGGTGLTSTDAGIQMGFQGKFPTRGVGSGTSRATDGDGGNSPRTTRQPLRSSPEPTVTAAEIRELLAWTDVRSALIQGRVFEQALRDQRVPEDDERFALLRQVLDELGRRFQPPSSQPPASQLKFRAALGEARSAMNELALPRAENKLREAEELLAAHPEELHHFRLSLQAARDLFESLAGMELQRARLREALREAEQALGRHAELGDRAELTLACQQLAVARFLSLRTSLDHQEFIARNREAMELENRIELARGRQAVKDARGCHRLHDAMGRDTQLAVARRLLPRFPASQSAPLLKEVEELAGEEVTLPMTTDVGSRLAARAAWEEALHLFGHRDLILQLTSVCVKHARRFPNLNAQLEGASQLEGVSLSKLVFDMLELELELQSHASPAGASHVTSDAYEALNQCLRASAVWKETERYRRIQSRLAIPPADS